MNEPNPAIESTTPAVKAEEGPQPLEAISKTDPGRHPRDASQSPTSSKTIKSENNGSSDALATAQEAPVIPTAAAAASTPSTIPAVAPPPGPALAAAPPVSLATPAAIPPAEPATPAKRSRSPEPDQELNADKKQKTEHVPEHDIQKIDEFKAEAGAEASAEAGGEANANGDGASSWDLESMLANALGAVNDAKGAAGADDAMDIDNLTSPPPLPPPRRRLEKMKFIETPTYFSRSMGLPILGSLVGTGG